MTTQPAIYIPHGGGPCFFMDWQPSDTWAELQTFLESIDTTLAATPQAIVVISAHWEQSEAVITGGRAPDLIYDYDGFPPHTYQLQYPAPGHPELAQRISDLLTNADVPSRINDTQGWDHGVFIPLLLMYPEATIPVVQISLRRDLDPEQHLHIGQALEPLRHDDVLIVGSGMSYHNFGTAGGKQAQDFDDWLHDILDQPPAQRHQQLIDWHQAPGANVSHPREEHLIPLMVCVGAAHDAPATRIFSAPIMNNPVSAYTVG